MQSYFPDILSFPTAFSPDAYNSIDATFTINKINTTNGIQINAGWWSKISGSMNFAYLLSSQILKIKAWTMKLIKFVLRMFVKSKTRASLFSSAFSEAMKDVNKEMGIRSNHGNRNWVSVMIYDTMSRRNFPPIF